MLLLEQIQIAQRNAGEDAVIANLERLGLVPPRPKSPEYMQGRADAVEQAVERIKATVIVDGETKEKMIEAITQRVADVGKSTAV
jgi:hypothetical protein